MYSMGCVVEIEGDYGIRADTAVIECVAEGHVVGFRGQRSAYNHRGYKRYHVGEGDVGPDHLQCVVKHTENFGKLDAASHLVDNCSKNIALTAGTSEVAVK